MSNRDSASFDCVGISAGSVKGITKVVKTFGKGWQLREVHLFYAEENSGRRFYHVNACCNHSFVKGLLAGRGNS